MVLERKDRFNFERHDLILADGDVVKIGGSENGDCRIRVVSTFPIEVEVTRELGGNVRGVRKSLEFGSGYRILSRYGFYPQTIEEGRRDFILVVPAGTNVQVKTQGPEETC